MKKSFLIIPFLAGLLALGSCAEEAKLSSVSEVNLSSLLYLEFTVNETEKCPVVFQYSEEGELNDTILIMVEQLKTKAKVKIFTLIDPAIQINLTVGEEVTFNEDDILLITLTLGGASKTYYVRMQEKEQEKSKSFFYVVKTSDVDDAGGKYYLNEAKAEKLIAVSETNYEGYADFTKTNWDNIGIVKPDLSGVFDVDGGFYPEQSYGSFVLTENTIGGGLHFKINGPWADWTWTGGNEAIVAPGVWKLNFDTSTNQLDLLEVQWAITGTATNDGVQAMTYTSPNKTWSVTANLSAGNIRFITIPISEGDPIITYGMASKTHLSETGNVII
ncbi:hypothetical protein EZS27_023007 [termite gut metagenome]|uniref:Uncharacterized protein n=1 Tax=termite gut metagenome TaxID=433724 RepID=A0A5J4R2D2_9ZZZZ